MTTMRQSWTALLILLVVLACAAGQNPELTPLPVGSATIAEVKGEVEFHSAEGEAVTAQRGAVLAADSKIDTAKGSVLLDLSDGSQILVKANSHVVLRSPARDKGYWLELLFGKINAKVQKRLGNTPSFRMGTPTAVITVRGTRFSVEFSKKQKTLVEVYEGLVEVAGFLQGAPVLLRPGFSTGVDLNRDPEVPHEMNHGEGRDGEGRDEDHRNPNQRMGGQVDDDRQRPGSQPPGPPKNDSSSGRTRDD
jgi:hypothetical protein